MPSNAGADFGTLEVELLSARCVGPHADPRRIDAGDAARIVLECEAHVPEPDLTIGIAIQDEGRRTVLGTNTKRMAGVGALPVRGRFTATFRFLANLAPGDYTVTVALHKGVSHTAGCYHWKDDAIRFSVHGACDSVPPSVSGFEFAQGWEGAATLGA